MSPIRPSEAARYPKDWPAISRRVREEAGQRCEWCGLENGAVGVRVDGKWHNFDHSWRVQKSSPLFPDTDRRPALSFNRYMVAGGWRKRVKIVLTVAHLDHTPENCARENLKALCQQCHLRYDKDLHQKNARDTRKRLTAPSLPEDKSARGGGGLHRLSGLLRLRSPPRRDDRPPGVDGGGDWAALRPHEDDDQRVRRHLLDAGLDPDAIRSPEVMGHEPTSCG